jgi:hypothetical protein
MFVRLTDKSSNKKNEPQDPLARMRKVPAARYDRVGLARHAPIWIPECADMVGGGLRDHLYTIRICGIIKSQIQESCRGTSVEEGP